MVVNNGSFGFGGIDFKPEFYKESSELSFNSENAVYIENVRRDVLDVVLLIYGNRKRSGGGLIKNHEYNENSQRLTIFYDSKTTVENVITFGQIEIEDKIYVAQINRPSTDGDEVNKCGK